MSKFNYITKEDQAKDLFYKIPKQFMLESKYKKMKDSSKILYSILYERTGLSIKNNWFDENNRAYIICTYDEIQVLFGCSRDKVSSNLKELEKYNLIKKDKVKTDEDTINVFYVAHVDTTSDTLDVLLDKHKSDYKKLRNKNREYKREYNKKQSELKKQKREKVESENQTTIVNTTIPRVKLIKASNCNGSLKIRLRGVRKTDYNKTDFNKTDSMYVCTAKADKKISADLLNELQRKSSSKSDPAAWLKVTVQSLIDKNIITLEQYKRSLKEFADKTYKKKRITSKVSTVKKNRFDNFDGVLKDMSKEEIKGHIDVSQNVKYGDGSLAPKKEMSKETDFTKKFYERAMKDGWDNISKAVLQQAIRYANQYGLEYPTELKQG